MADNELDEQIGNNPELQKALDKSDVPTKKAEKSEPLYKIINQEEKIPVSKHLGKVWHARKNRGLKHRDTRYESSWDQAIRYYNMEQSSHRTDDDNDSSQTVAVDEASKRQNSHTENIVFANVSALVPQIYAKNPHVEVTQRIAANEAMATDIETFMNAMLTRKAFPRLSLKSEARRAVICTALTNVSYVCLDYTKKSQTSDQARQTLQELADELVNAKSTKEVEEVEAKIQAIENSIDFLSPEGTSCKFLAPKQVVRDPSCTAEHFRDDPWLMIWDYLPTRYLQAVYGTDKSGGEKMIFEPSHVIPAEKQKSGAQGRNSAEIEIDAYELLGDTSKGSDYGYNNDAAYKDAQMTKVWKIWDKSTRRLYMFADNNWEWPVWVWNDPYNLVDFYPLAQLVFYTDPLEGIGKSEVSYYLDQQDSINEKNSELRSARRHAKFNLAYNKNKVLPTEVDSMMDSTKPRALGLDLGEGEKVEDVLKAVVPPSMQYAELFDKRDDLDAIYRISSVTQGMTGAEYRTNTTNKAIESYNSTETTRLDEKIDAIEDFISEICWIALQMCIQFMDKELVAQVVGVEDASRWTPMDSKELQSRIGSLQVVGGSTQKPNSRAKQQMALELGQVLGQFAGAMPPVAIVMLKAIERAFDDVVIQKEEWATINQAVQQMSQPQQSQQGAPSQGNPQQEQQESISPEQIQQLLAQLPPEAQQAVEQAVSQGVPVEAAVMKVVETLQSQQPTQ